MRLVPCISELVYLVNVIFEVEKVLVPHWVMNAVLTVSDQMVEDNKGEDWPQKQDDHVSQVSSWLGWAENLTRHILIQSENKGSGILRWVENLRCQTQAEEGVVGEDKVG